MFENMFEKALKKIKGRQFFMSEKKGRQRCYMADKCNI